MSPDKSNLAPALFAEAFGTFSLVFAGCGAIVVDEVHGGAVGHVGIALTFGLVVMAMIYAVGDVSGAHLNPAVTFGFHAAGRFPRARILPYVASQLAGGLTAAALLRALFAAHETSLGVTAPAGGAAQTFVLEVVLTLVLMFVILRVSSGSYEQGMMAGAAVGGVIALEALFAGPVSGASMNPVRSLAPAVLALRLEDVWIYLLAPPVGAWLAVRLCRLVPTPGCCPVEETA